MIDRRNTNVKFEAQIHGCEVNIPDVKEKAKKEIQVSDEQQGAIDRAIEDAKLRKAKEHGR